MLLIKYQPYFLSRLRFFSSKNISNVGTNELKSVQIKRLITAKDLDTFTTLSGDTNPVHFGDKGIVHGALLNSLVSGVIGTKLPGHGTILISQTLNFPNKCFVNEVVTVTVKIVEQRKIIKVEFECEVEGEKKIVLFGDAKLIYNKSMS